MNKEISRILRIKEVINRTGLSRSTIYDWMSKGKFPKARRLGDRAVGWSEKSISDWIDSRGNMDSGGLGI